MYGRLYRVGTHRGLVEADLDDTFPEDLFAKHAHLFFDEQVKVFKNYRGALCGMPISFGGGRANVLSPSQRGAVGLPTRKYRKLLGGYSRNQGKEN